MTDELGRIWKKLVLVCYKVLSQHLPGVTEKPAITLKIRHELEDDDCNIAMIGIMVCH
jgi:hypothetical protein